MAHQLFIKIGMHRTAANSQIHGMFHGPGTRQLGSLFLHHGLAQGVQCHRGGAAFDALFLIFANDQNILQHFGHAFDGQRNGAKQFSAFRGRQACVVMRQQVRRRQNGGQRCAEFMGGHGHKTGLELVEFFLLFQRRPNFLIGHTALGNVSDKGAKLIGAGIVQRHPGDRQFNGKLATALVQRADFDTPVNHARLTAGHIAGHAVQMRLAVALRDHGVMQGAPQCFVGTPAEDKLRLRVPPDNLTNCVDPNHGVQRGVHNPLQFLFAFGQHGQGAAHLLRALRNAGLQITVELLQFAVNAFALCNIFYQLRLRGAQLGIGQVRTLLRCRCCGIGGRVVQGNGTIGAQRVKNGALAFAIDFGRGRLNRHHAQQARPHHQGYIQHAAGDQGARNPTARDNPWFHLDQHSIALTRAAR